MRTKTLALSAVLGLLGSASAMATNVYSLNAVGYINVTMPPGFSIVTCPLIVGTDTEYASTYGGTAVTNDLNVVFNNDNGQYNKAIILAFNNGAAFSSISDSGWYNSGSHIGGWSGGTLGAGPWGAAGQSDIGQGIQLLPGQGVFFNNNTLTAMTATFVGTVPQGSLTNVLVPGYNCIASMVPVSGDLVLNSISGGFFANTVNASGPTHGYQVNGNQGPAVGDFIENYNNTTKSYQGNGSWSGSWSSGLAPGGADPFTSSVAQGFLYWNAAKDDATVGNGGAVINGVNYPAGTEIWVETFTINP